MSSRAKRTRTPDLELKELGLQQRLRLAQQSAAGSGPQHVRISLPDGRIREHTGTCHCSHAVVEEIPNGGHRDATASHKYSVEWFPNHTAALHRQKQLLRRRRRSARNCWIEKTVPVARVSS